MLSFISVRPIPMCSDSVSSNRVTFLHNDKTCRYVFSNGGEILEKILKRSRACSAQILDYKFGAFMSRFSNSSVCHGEEVNEEGKS